MKTLNQFQYVYENITLYQFQSDWIIFAIALIIGVIAMATLYYLMLMTSLKSIVYLAEQVLARKKKILSELILMKDIQTELEKEIEQAILKAAFHS